MKKAEINATGDNAVDNQVEQLKLNPDEELALLKGKADILGVKYRSNTTIEGLKEKILDKQEEDAQKELTAGQPVASNEVATTRGQLMAQQKAEQLKLVRVRISNLNPKKKEMDGEIFAVSNGIVGVVKKYIPYKNSGENGYHIPLILLNNLKDRKFDNSYYDTKNSVVVNVWSPEFGIEILPPLTDKELARLAAAQASRGDQTN